MQIKRGGIYKTIDSKDFGIYQSAGWIKVVKTEVAKIVEEPIKEEEPVVEPVEEPVVEEEVPVVEEPVVTPKPKKKKSI